MRCGNITGNRGIVMFMVEGQIRVWMGRYGCDRVWVDHLVVSSVITDDESASEDESSQQS